MCGRYVHAYTWLRIYEQLSAYISSLNESLRSMPGPPASYNVAPTQAVPVLRVGDGGIVPAMMRWWLVPSWAKSADESKYATFNARSEDAAAKPAFRSPYKRRRCVLPASGFYEWQKLDAKTKRPHYITRADGEPAPTMGEFITALGEAGWAVPAATAAPGAVRGRVTGADRPGRVGAAWARRLARPAAPGSAPDR